MSSSRRSVLILDEKLGPREVLAGLLRDRGYALVGDMPTDGLAKSEAKVQPACVIGAVGDDPEEIRERVVQWRSEFSAPLLAVVAQHDVKSAVTAVKAGAFDVLETPLAPDAVQAAVEGAIGSVEDEMLTSREGARRRLARLTARERDVLRGLLAGKINKTIGQELGISPRTVEVYRSHIMTKARVDSLPDLLRLASQAGAG